MSILPVLSVLLSATNGIHGLLWSGGLAVQGGYYYLDRTFNPLFFIFILHNHGIMIFSWYFLLRRAIGSKEIYRGQMLAFVVGSITPVTAGTMFVLDAYPGVPSYIDLTPVGFSVLALLYGFAIYRYRLLDLVPVARDTVVGNMRDGFVVLDTDDRIIDFNHAAVNLLQFDDEVIGEHIDDILPALGAIVANHEHGSQYEQEFTLTLDGEQRFLVANCSTLNEEDDDTDDESRMGRLLILQDITDRRAVQKRYQALIENASDLILVLDPDGTITYASPSITNVTGASPDQITGKNTFDLVHEEDREQLENVFDEVVQNPDATARYEYRTPDTDGNWLVMEGVARNMLDNPFVEGIIVNAREITERKERERELEETNEQLEETNDQLEETNQQLEQFASVVSHDLRNPLNVADGYVQIAQEKYDDEIIDEISYSHSRMEAIIEDVLTLAREGDSIGETEHVGLGTMAANAWEHVATDEATLEVVDDGSFEADPDRLTQLLENLFRNAHEHVGEDVTVRVGIEDGWWYVEDDGPGVPEEKRDEILEWGYTTNEDGTGFGLAIVTQVASAHEWDVAVTDGSDGGARFTFTGIEQRTAEA
jgi:PAS domain S-box-containing protein